MKKIEDLFTDMFDLSEIINERLLAYGIDQISRITDNNPGGVFDGIKLDTQNAWNNFGGAIQSLGSNIGDRKGQTTVKDTARGAFNIYISQKEGLVKSTFGLNSLQYKQFFPDGLTVFGRASEIEYPLLLTNIVARATQYEADLGTPFKTAVTALATAYTNAEEAQTSEKSEVSTSRGDAETTRAALTRQLTINALTIALQFPLDTTKVSVYFDTSLLFAQKRKRILRGKPAAGVTKKAGKIEYSHGKLVHMKNKGATALVFQMYLNDEPVGATFTVAAGKELEKKMEDFFTNADALYVTNTGTQTGQYQVDIIA